MPELDDLRDALHRTRTQRVSAADALAAARAAVKAHATQQTATARVAKPGDDHEAELEARRLEAVVARAHDAHTAALAAEQRALAALDRFTDPTKNLGRLGDQTPILLLPVRVETRFKTVTLRDRAQPQLWVRVFPDDCWIDTFHPTLSAGEVTNARSYWIDTWKAGGVEAQQRAAWRTLVSAHGSGRARWIVSQYVPVNAGDRPSKPRAEDVILVIAVETAPPPGEVPAIAAFWRAMWRADGAAAAAAAARAALEAAVGSDRAKEIATKLVPANFTSPLAGDLDKSEVNVDVSVLVLPPAPAPEGAWARAPRIDALPERFVFLGYRTGEPPLVVVGEHVPATLVVGPDPSAPAAEQLRRDANGNVVMPDEMKWLSEFDRAVDVGMGFRIPLTAAQAREGFDRVVVLGVRMTDGKETSAPVLERLLAHHAASRKGLAVVPQGTPTNNTEAASSGLARLDDPDDSFDDRSPRFTIESSWRDKRDGQWLAEYLGVDPQLFQHVRGADATDLRAARAMHQALWPATLGYWMESMMTPAFTRRAIQDTRAFFERNVVGGGAIPALRIGTQPYGILPATAFSRMEWFRGDDHAEAPRSAPYLQRLYGILGTLQVDWEALAKNVSYVGRAGDPHQLLLDILGLHPGSVEWSQRYAEDLQTVFNRLNLRGLGGLFQALVLSLQRAAAIGKLGELGAGDEVPPILDKLFSGRHQELRGGVVDDQPLSERDPLRAQTTGGTNYLRWLVDAARDSLDALYTQAGFVGDTPPRALLYLLLRHALQLGYHDTGIALYQLAGLYDASRAQLARRDDPFLHVRDNVATSESRYQLLYAQPVEVTGNATVPVHRFIAARLPTLVQASSLRDQLAAIERLQREPTARLERAFADHVDCCSYRLDAWLLGLVDHQLGIMRGLDTQGTARRGVHLGAYAWLEDVRPENKVLVPHEIADPEVAADFAGATPLVRDSTNQGYIHAPSSSHAVAAAVLRNGYLSNASPANRQTLAVNLSSERVRTALELLEGVRAGQSLADLLGYRFERGLHDRHGLAEVDKFIYKLRKAFPLRADRMSSTKTAEGVSIESIEARNVIDGLALVEQMIATGVRTYPFDKTGLPPATAAEAAAIDAEALRLLDAHDAVADVALAEGVYQAVLGNYDRVASTYEAYARGNFPPEPDIVRTPTLGTVLTHRVALHLDAAASSVASPVGGIAMTPRAQAEPAINAWLASVLPAPADVGCLVTFRDAATNTTRRREVTLDRLALQPIDLVAIVRDGDSSASAELDERVVRYVNTSFGPRPDAPISIEYLEKDTAAFSVFELMPLVRAVRRILAKSRPLRATDLALPSEARTPADGAREAQQARLDLVRSALQVLRTDADALANGQQARLDDPTRRGELIDNVDDDLAALVTLLANAARFTMPHAGWGFAYELRRRVFAAVLTQAAERVDKWNARLVEFGTVLGREAALPPTATDVQRFVILQKAERVLSTTSTVALPPTPAAFRDSLVNVLQAAFVAKRDELAALATTTETSLAALLDDVRAILPLAAFDDDPYTVTAHEDQIVAFAEDAVGVLRAIVRECDRRLALVTDEYATYAGSVDGDVRLRALEAAAKALLGEDFVIVPAFTLAAPQGDELDNALAESRSGALFTHLTTAQGPGVEPLEDFPVDTWLYGIARVREKLHAWEQTMILAGSLGRAEPALEALQLPFQPGDRWLGLELAPGTKLDRDRLLYTASFTVPFAKAAPQCGLLVDEWTETIPGTDVDTGIAFQHDRPNCEAPQTMLLVTPTRFRGAWSWDDLVDALAETFELAKVRAVEPSHLDATPYGWFLPATIMAAQVRQLTIAANLALNNQITLSK